MPEAVHRRSDRFERLRIVSDYEKFQIRHHSLQAKNSIAKNSSMGTCPCTFVRQPLPMTVRRFLLRFVPAQTRPAGTLYRKNKKHPPLRETGGPAASEIHRPRSAHESRARREFHRFPP
jgi:hypothetical protein